MSQKWKKYKMDKTYEMKRLFKQFLCAQYAKYVTCQQSLRFYWSIEERNVQFSGKHKLYGFKTEIYVFAIGIAINVTKDEPRLDSGLEMFQKNQNFHKYVSQKIGAQQEDVNDEEQLSEEYEHL